MITLPESIGREVIADVRYSVDRYGYRVDGKFYRRVTTFLGTVPKPWLAPWMTKLAAVYALDHMDELKAMVEAGERDDALKLIKGAANEYRDERADRGSAIHTAVESLIAGQAMPGWTDEDQYDCARAVQLYLRERGGKPLATELTVFNQTQGYAGTLDYWDVRGDVYGLCDWKSSKDVYVENALQLTMYRNAEYAIYDKVPVPGRSDEWTGKVIPWRAEYAATLDVCHVTPEGVKAYPILDDPELAKRLWDTCRAAAFMYHWSRDTDGFKKQPKVRVFGEPNVHELTPTDHSTLADELEASLREKEGAAA